MQLMPYTSLAYRNSRTFFCR